MLDLLRPAIDTFSYSMVPFLFVAIAIFVSPAAQAGDDVQGWSTIELKKRLGPSWEVFVIPEVRIRDTISERFYHEFRQGVRWTPSPHWTVGLNYLFARNASSGRQRSTSSTGKSHRKNDLSRLS